MCRKLHNMSDTKKKSVYYSISLSNVAKRAAHSKLVWVFNANCDGTIIYNDPVVKLTTMH
jgi:hypothetical protein